MIHMIPYGKIPKNYHDTRVHYLTSRNTIYGIHKPVTDGSSKTCIVCFSDERDAHTFKTELLNVQRSGKLIDRCEHGPNTLQPYVDTKTKGSILPISMTSTRIIEIMKMCHLNFFDMYLVFDVEQYDHNYLFNYYMFQTSEIPHRGYINCSLEQLLL